MFIYLYNFTHYMVIFHIKILPAPMAERSNAKSCPLAVIACRSLCPEKLGSNPGQGSKGINFSGWHGLDMSVTVTKRR